MMPVLVVRDLGIHNDANVSMKSHVMKTTSACFAVLRQLRGIRRSVPRTALAIGDECGRTARLRVIKSVAAPERQDSQVTSRSVRS